MSLAETDPFAADIALRATRATQSPGSGHGSAPTSMSSSSSTAAVSRAVARSTWT